MLREAQRRFREGYHPECQWSIRQQGVGQESTDKLRRTWLLWCFLGSCLRTESLETEKANLFFILVS